MQAYETIERAAYADLYEAAKQADAAWQAELVQVYGQQASEARYRAAGIATETLFALKSAFLRASTALLQATRNGRQS